MEFYKRYQTVVTTISIILEARDYTPGRHSEEGGQLANALEVGYIKPRERILRRVL